MSKDKKIPAEILVEVESSKGPGFKFQGSPDNNLPAVAAIIFFVVFMAAATLFYNPHLVNGFSPNITPELINNVTSSEQVK